MADKESRTVLKDRVFVGKLPRGVSEQDLRRVFSEGGYSVRDIHIQHSARDRDFAFVSFNDERDVEAILETVSGVHSDSFLIKYLTKPSTNICSIPLVTHKA